MARKIDSEWQAYVPESYGIRADYLEGKDPDPVVIEIHPLSAKQARDYERIMVQKVRRDGVIDLGNSEEVARKSFVENVRQVQNYTDRDGVPIVTGADLWERGENELVLEVAAAIQKVSKLEAGRLDRLRSQSAGSRPATSPSDGTASLAGTTGETVSGIAASST